MTNGDSFAQESSPPRPDVAGDHPTVRLGATPAPDTMDATRSLQPPSAPEPAPAPASEPPPPVGEDRGASPRPGAPPREPDLETVVIEADVIPRRLRRPIDLLRLLSAFTLAAVILGVAYFASAAAAGLESDLTKASGSIPGVIVVAANVIGLLGVLALPIAAAFDLVPGVL